MRDKGVGAYTPNNKRLARKQKGMSWLTKPLSGLLIDITGVLYESGTGGGTAIPGSSAAIERLRAAGYHIKFCTNESHDTRQHLLEKLQQHGFTLTLADIFSPAPACVKYLKENKLRPFLLVHPSALPEYSGVDCTNPDCVVLGDACEMFTYENMNKAFRILINGDKPTLISLGQGKYYREDGQLALDVGPFSKALEHATKTEPIIIGKPSEAYFRAAIQELGVSPEHALMIGDDLHNDVAGAQSAGLRGVLVRTGKYRASDEHHKTVQPDEIVDNLAEFVDALLQHQPHPHK